MTKGRISLLLACAMVLWATAGFSAVSGQCTGCHTMHNSQNGEAMPTAGDTALNGALLNKDCLGCHTGDNTQPNLNAGLAPKVLASNSPTYSGYDAAGVDKTGESNTLAGGNFWWVEQGDDTAGHNVDLLNNNSDTNFAGAPPGFGSGKAAYSDTQAPAGGSWNLSTNKLTCAGTYGCHGSHNADTGSMAAISGAHHSGADGQITKAIAQPATGAKAANGYRFLLGITGYEDSDYEFQPTDTAHNVYSGVHAPDGNANDSSTISYLCSECHGNFHGSAANVGDSSAWLRHPTDYDMGHAGGEYAGYNGNGTAYSVIAPVAMETIPAAANSTVTTSSAAGTAIVTCLSCHRAHGSPYADILRWDYAEMQAETSGSFQDKGCFICHTTKDAD